MNRLDRDNISPEQTEGTPAGKWAKLVFGLMVFSLLSLLGAEYLAFYYYRPPVPLHLPPSPITLPSILMSLSALAALLSLTLSAVVSIRSRKRQKSAGEESLLGWGIVISLFLLLALPITTEIPCARIKADSAHCLSNGRELSLALLLYTDEHNNTFPPADHWCDAVLPYVKSHNKKIFVCPDARNQTCSYALNKNIAGKSINEIDQPTDCVAVFESDLGWNKAGDASDLPQPARHSTGNNYGFADGHAKWSKPEYVADYWSPRAATFPKSQIDK
jgi:prepilin-type processing-associated H-X9-DG protein